MNKSFWKSIAVSNNENKSCYISYKSNEYSIYKHRTWVSFLNSEFLLILANCFWFLLFWVGLLVQASPPPQRGYLTMSRRHVFQFLKNPTLFHNTFCIYFLKKQHSFTPYKKKNETLVNTVFWQTIGEITQHIFTVFVWEMLWGKNATWFHTVEEISSSVFCDSICNFIFPGSLS